MAIVGSAFVSIRGDTSKLAGDIANANLGSVGQRLGAQLSSTFDRQVAQLAPKLSAAFGAVQVPDVTVGVTADTSEAQGQLSLFEQQANATDLDLGGVKVPDLDPLLTDLRDIRAEADRAAEGIAHIESAGKDAVKLGGKLSLGITAPLVLLGRTAVGSAADLERTLSQVVGLAGGTADDVTAALARIRSLAGETGKPVADLGDALLAIFSAGFTGAQALDVLEVSGKAAAAGLGETRDVANAVTNALGAYGSGVITAQQATDVLVNTVKEGKAEASDLAPQFGRLLPVASELGISFSDVGAGLAFLTRSSGDASLSATQLAGVLNKLLKPSQQGAEALLAAGFSTDKLRDSLQNRGLLATLVDIRTQVESTGGSLSSVFEDAEGLAGALSLTADKGADAQQVFDHLAASTGTLDSAFNAFSDTNAAKLDRASASFSVATERVGEVILPVLAQVLSVVAGVVGVFSELPGPVQQVTVGLLATAAAAGPLLVIGGKLAQNITKLISLAPGLTSKLAGIGESAGLTSGRLSQAAGAAGILATAAVVGGGFIQARLASDDQAVEKFASNVETNLNKAATQGFDQFNAQVQALNTGIDDLAGAQSKGLLAGINPFNIFSDRQLKEGTKQLDQLRAQFGPVRQRALDLAVAFNITNDAALQLALGGDAAVAAFQRQREEIGKAVDPAQAAERAVTELQLAYLRGADTAQLFTDAQALTGLATEDLQNQLQAAADDANKLGDAFVQGLAGIDGAFKATFGDDKKDTLKGFFADFRDSATKDLLFTANLEALVARGATGLAASFAGQGLAAADLAAEAAGLSDAALKDQETKFDFLTLQENRAADRQRAFATRLTDGTLSLVDQANTAAEGLFGPDVAETIGPRLAAALAQGDDAFFAELDRIAGEARTRSAAIGEGVGEGTADGLAASIAAVEAAAQRVVDSTIGIFTRGFRIGSPSKVMMSLGGDVADGFAIGVTSGLGKVDLAPFMAQLPSAAQLAARSALASPAFGAVPAGPPGAAAAGAVSTVTFTGDIVVPVPPGATPAEQASAVGKYVNWTLAGAVG